MNTFRTSPPDIHHINSLNFEHVEAIVLNNGIRCYRMPNRELGVTKLDVLWPFGTREQENKYVARTSLALALSGTDKLTAEQINEEFEYQGTSYGHETQMLQSVLHLKCKKSAFLSSFSFFLENYNSAIYPDNEIVNYAQIEKAGLMRKMQTPGYWAHRLCFESLFEKDSPMASFADSSDIALLKKAHLIAFHEQFLSLQNATYILSGETGDDIFNEVKMKLEALPRPKFEGNPNSIHEDYTPILGVTISKHMEHSHQVSLYMGMPFGPISETEIHQFALLNMLLGGFFGSRLMQEIREEKGLTYGIGSYITQSNTGNVWCISGEMNAQNVDLAREAILNILTGLSSHPPMGDELEKAKRYYSGQLRSSFDGPFALPGKIKNMLVRGYSYQYYDSALDTIWKTSSDDLCQIAYNYLKPDSFNTVLAGDIRE